MSRKIVFRGGFDNCFSKPLKTRQNTKLPSYCLSEGMKIGKLNLKLNQWLNVSRESINFVPNTGIFLGLGLLSGRFGNESKVISAPLIIFPAEFDPDSNDAACPQVDYSSPQLNIDLFASLLYNRSNENDDNDIILSTINGDILEKIKEIEKLLNTPIKSYLGQEGAELANKVLDKVIQCLPSLNIYKIGNFSHEEFTESLEKNNPLIFSPSAFYFNTNKPSDITTFFAINEMMNQLDSGHVENELLGELIESSIEQREPSFNNNSDEEGLVDDSIINYLPIELSDSQRAGLINAWTKRISYIQGPPGTGKSHTICAIIMMGAILNKRVLLVSNKNAALSVVKDKLKRILGADHLDVAARDVEIRKEQKAKLEKIKEELQSVLRNKGAYIAKTEYDLSKIKKEIDDNIKRREVVKNLIGSYIKKSKETFEAIQVFLDSLKMYSDKYGNRHIQENTLSRICPAANLIKTANEIKNLVEKNEIEQKHFKKLELLKMRAFRTFVQKSVFILPLEEDNKDFIKLTDYISLLNNCDIAESKRKEIPGNQSALRIELISINKKISEQSSKFICKKLELKKLRDVDNNVKLIGALSQIFYYRNPSKISTIMTSNRIDKIGNCLPQDANPKSRQIPSPRSWPMFLRFRSRKGETINPSIY